MTPLALGGPLDWGIQTPDLWQLREHVLRTVEREQQQGLIRQMERYTSAQAYFRIRIKSDPTLCGEQGR